MVNPLYVLFKGKLFFSQQSVTAGGQSSLKLCF